MNRIPAQFISAANQLNSLPFESNRLTLDEHRQTGRHGCADSYTPSIPLPERFRRQRIRPELLCERGVESHCPNTSDVSNAL